MKKQMKKCLALILCLWAAAGLLTACGEAAPTEPPTVPTQQTQPQGLALADTVWCYEDTEYLFYADGTLGFSGASIQGSYTWDGQNGTVQAQDAEARIFAVSDVLYMEGEDGNAYRLSYVCALADYAAPTLALPSPEDPLDCEVKIPDSSPAVYISYPETMKVVSSGTQLIQLDAVQEELEMENCILVNLVEIGTGFDHYFTSGPSQAENGLAYMMDLWSEGAYGDQIITRMETEFEDCGWYYAFRQYVWFSGDVFVEPSDTPVLGVMEMRYYGPTGYVLVFSTAADQGRFENYAEIAQNIFNAVEYGGDWSTEPASYSDGRGDYFEDDDGRGDYFGDDDGRGDVIP